MIQTRSLDSDAILNLPALLSRQRAAFLRDGPPPLARRRANLKKLRAAVLARRADLEVTINGTLLHYVRSRFATRS